MIADSKVLLTAQQRRPFWFPKPVEREVALDRIVNVERVDATVRLEIDGPELKPDKLQFVMVSAEAAESIAKILPSTRTHSFVPLLAEGAAFNSI